MANATQFVALVIVARQLASNKDLQATDGRTQEHVRGSLNLVIEAAVRILVDLAIMLCLC